METISASERVSALSGSANLWRPYPKQIEFLQIPDSIFERFFGGAAGPGKSELIVMFPIVRQITKEGPYKGKSFIDHPKFKGIAFRRSFPELEASLIPRSKEWYPKFGGKYNETKKKWYFPSGATMQFGFIEREDDVRAYDTAEFQYAGFDELTHFTEFQYLYFVLSRIRSTVPELPPMVCSASNPGNIGNQWVRDRFVAPCKVGGKVLVDSKTGLKRIFIPAKLYDNPTLTINDPGYVNRLNALPEAERKAKAEGDFWAFSGQVFSEFRHEKYLSEPDNALHVIPPFEIPDWWPKFNSTDWGYDHKTWSGWGALSPDNRLIVFKEYVCRNTAIESWGSDLKRIEQHMQNVVSHVLDPSAWQERGLPHTVASQFIEATGFDVDKADNDRIGGKMLLHEYLRWEQHPPKYIPATGYDPLIAQRLLRMRGYAALEAYEKSFEPAKPETNLPKLQIFNTCTELINVIPLCVYAEKEGEASAKAEDVKKFNGDDAYDGIRYMLKQVNSWMGSLEKEVKRREEYAKVHQLAQTDPTSFYIQMAKLEKKDDGVVMRSSYRHLAHTRVR